MRLDQVRWLMVWQGWESVQVAHSLGGVGQAVHGLRGRG